MSRTQGAIGLAICGGLSTLPLAVGVVGWENHWNAYTNLLLTLGGVLLWAVLITSCRQAERGQSEPE